MEIQGLTQEEIKWLENLNEEELLKEIDSITLYDINGRLLSHRHECIRLYVEKKWNSNAQNRLNTILINLGDNKI